MFSILIWQDSCSLSYFSCTCLFWLALLALCALFCHASGIVCLRALHSTFKLYFTDSSVTGRLPSFFPGHSVSLALLAHWSFLTTFPLVLLGPKWNVRPLKDFEEIILDAAEQQSFQPFLIICVLKVTGASHSYWNPTMFSWFALNYCFEQKGGCTWHYEFCHIPQCLHQNSPFRWTLGFLHPLPKPWSTHRACEARR